MRSHGKVGNYRQVMSDAVRDFPWQLLILGCHNHKGWLSRVWVREVHEGTGGKVQRVWVITD